MSLVICKNCGKEYSSRRGKSCSLRCRDEYEKKKRREGIDLKRKCQICTTEFEIHYSHRKSMNTGKFCSMKCVGENNRRLLTGTTKIEWAVAKCGRPDCTNMFERPAERRTTVRYQKYCSKSCRARTEITHFRHKLHSKMYYVTLIDGSRLLVCSRWEAAFIKTYLEPNNVEYQYEPRTFTFDDGMSYTPDFYLPKLDKYIEIKGYAYRGTGKVDRLRATGVNIDLVDAETLTDIYGLDLRHTSLQLLVEEKVKLSVGEVSPFHSAV